MLYLTELTVSTEDVLPLKVRHLLSDRMLHTLCVFPCRVIALYRMLPDPPAGSVCFVAPAVACKALTEVPSSSRLVRLSAASFGYVVLRLTISVAPGQAALDSPALATPPLGRNG